MPPVTEKERQIILGASVVFMKYGVKSVNMDDVARNLGISKKTLYKYVKDKNDLVGKALEAHHMHEMAAMEEIFSKGLNAIDEMFEMSSFISSMLNTLHPSIHFDLEKYHPIVWKDMKCARDQAVFNFVFQNLEKGKAEGLYRENLNSDVITEIYISKIDVLFDGQVFPPERISFSEVYKEFFRYHIRGIASRAGREYLSQKMNSDSKSKSN